MTTTASSAKFETYPSFFRQELCVDHGDDDDQHHPNSSAGTKSYDCSLPVIDFQQMKPESLTSACRDWGMFRLVNHNVPVNILNQLIESANELFSSLSFESKESLFTSSPIHYFWGSPALSSSGNGQRCSDNINWLEGLNVPLSKISGGFRYEDSSLLESFRSLLEEYGIHQTRLVKGIFSTMAKDLNIKQTISESYLSESTSILRVYRYLRCPAADERWGIDSHTDSSVLSIVHQDHVGGLQVFKKNKWYDVEPVHNTLIVNVGDMMQAMSNDEYISAQHRVRVHKHRERISIGCFVFPVEDAVIESSKYKPFTYGDFRAMNELDVKNLGFKVGLKRFRIQENGELTMTTCV